MVAFSARMLSGKLSRMSWTRFGVSLCKFGEFIFVSLGRFTVLARGVPLGGLGV